MSKQENISERIFSTNNLNELCDSLRLVVKTAVAKPDYKRPSIDEDSIIVSNNAEAMEHIFVILNDNRFLDIVYCELQRCKASNKRKRDSESSSEAESKSSFFDIADRLLSKNGDADSNEKEDDDEEYECALTVSLLDIAQQDIQFFLNELNDHVMAEYYSDGYMDHAPFEYSITPMYSIVAVTVGDMPESLGARILTSEAQIRSLAECEGHQFKKVKFMLVQGGSAFPL